MLFIEPTKSAYVDHVRYLNLTGTRITINNVTAVSAYIIYQDSHIYGWV